MNTPRTHFVPSTISSTLLGQARLLDPRAWDRLVQVYGPLVYRWCIAAGLSCDDAQDTGQEVFRAVAQSISSFRRERAGDSFLAWLRIVTRNKIADFRRAASVRPIAIGGSDFLEILEQVAEPTIAASDADELQEHSLLYRRALEVMKSEFRPTTWRAFWATAVDGLSTRDVAAELQISEMSVRQAKSRVLRRLRDVFQHDLGSSSG